MGKIKYQSIFDRGIAPVKGDKFFLINSDHQIGCIVTKVPDEPGPVQVLTKRGRILTVDPSELHVVRSR